MSTRPPQESTGILDHLTMRYLRRALDASHPTDEPYVMSDVEVFLTQRVIYATLFTTGFISALTVLLFQFSRLSWPDFFAKTDVVFVNTTVALPLITILYALLLLYLAVYLTTAVNRLGTRAIAQICQFPRLHDLRYEHHIETMFRMARSKRQPFRLGVGIRAYMAWSRSGLLLYFAASAVIGFVVSSLVSQWLSPYVSPWIAVGAGIALYTVWLVYRAWRVQFELRIRILAPLTIRSFVNELREEWHTDEQFQEIVTDALNFAGILSSLHIYVHLLLAETLTDRVSAAVLPHAPDDFTPKMAALPVVMQRSVERLLLFSMLIDGHFTGKEHKRLKQLQAQNLLTYTMSDIKQLRDDYIAGKGLWL